MENTAVNSNMTNRETEAKGLNTEINPLFSILDKSEEFRRLQAGLCGCKGPAGVFGLGEAQRTHIEAALFSKAKRPMLVVVPSEQAAARNFAAIIPMRCFFRQGNCRSMPTAMFSHRN